MVSRPEIVAYKSNAAVVFLVNFLLYLFLQPQRPASAATTRVIARKARRSARNDLQQVYTVKRGAGGCRLHAVLGGGPSQQSSVPHKPSASPDCLPLICPRILLKQFDFFRLYNFFCVRHRFYNNLWCVECVFEVMACYPSVFP